MGTMTFRVGVEDTWAPVTQNHSVKYNYVNMGLGFAATGRLMSSGIIGHTSR